MDFAPTEEQRMTCDVARKFFAREFPLARLREVEAQGLGAFMPVYRKMGELGFLGIGVPESCGGGGGGWLDLALFAEEAGRALVPTLQVTSVVLAGQALLTLGDAGKQRERLRALTAGESVIAPAWLESAEASRGPALATTAVMRDDRIELEGIKRYVEACDVASELLVAARDPDGNARFYLVPRASPGLTASEHRLTSLERVHDVRLGRVSLPATARLGGAWNDWLDVVDGAKIVVGAWAVGAARAALDMAVAYAKVREQFNRPIGSFQAVQHRLADAAISVEQASAMVRYAAWLHETVGRCSRDAAMARLVAGRAVRQVTHAAMLTHGGYGFMEEYDIQLYFRRAKQLEHIVEGPVLQRELIAGEDVSDGFRV